MKMVSLSFCLGSSIFPFLAVFKGSDLHLDFQLLLYVIPLNLYNKSERLQAIAHFKNLFSYMSFKIQSVYYIPFLSK